MLHDIGPRHVMSVCTCIRLPILPFMSGRFMQRVFLVALLHILAACASELPALFIFFFVALLLLLLLLLLPLLSVVPFFITETHRFPTVVQLIMHHAQAADGLVCPLLYPAPKKERQSAAAATAAVTSVQSSFDDWEIDRNEIMTRHKLGSGQYGDVYEAVWRRYNSVVAVKTLKQDVNLNLSDFLAEAAIMKNLNHKNLVRLLGVCTREPPFYIVTEYIPHGNLLNYLRQRSPGELTPPILLYMAVQIASGMAYLEAKSFIHRDLAARNCLVGDNNVIKVADFGLARCMQLHDTYTARNGAKFPIKWTAPEGLAYFRFSSKSDIWAFGVVLWELATYGLSPYPGVELHGVYQLLEKGYRMERPHGCPEAVYSIMLRCWAWEPADRPTFAEVRQELERMRRTVDLDAVVAVELSKRQSLREPSDVNHLQSNACAGSTRQLQGPPKHCLPARPTVAPSSHQQQQQTFRSPQPAPPPGPPLGRQPPSSSLLPDPQTRGVVGNSGVPMRDLQGPEDVDAGEDGDDEIDDEDDDDNDDADDEDEEEEEDDASPRKGAISAAPKSNVMLSTKRSLGNLKASGAGAAADSLSNELSSPSASTPTFAPAQTNAEAARWPVAHLGPTDTAAVPEQGSYRRAASDLPVSSHHQHTNSKVSQMSAPASYPGLDGSTPSLSAPASSQVTGIAAATAGRAAGAARQQQSQQPLASYAFVSGVSSKSMPVSGAGVGRGCEGASAGGESLFYGNYGKDTTTSLVDSHRPGHSRGTKDTITPAESGVGESIVSTDSPGESGTGNHMATSRMAEYIGFPVDAGGVQAIADDCVINSAPQQSTPSALLSIHGEGTAQTGDPKRLDSDAVTQFSTLPPQDRITRYLESLDELSSRQAATTNNLNACLGPPVGPNNNTNNNSNNNSRRPFFPNFPPPPPIPIDPTAHKNSRPRNRLSAAEGNHRRPAETPLRPPCYQTVFDADADQLLSRSMLAKASRSNPADVEPEETVVAVATAEEEEIALPSPSPEVASSSGYCDCRPSSGERWTAESRALDEVYQAPSRPFHGSVRSVASSSASGGAVEETDLTERLNELSMQAEVLTSACPQLTTELSALMNQLAACRTQIESRLARETAVSAAASGVNASRGCGSRDHRSAQEDQCLQGISQTLRHIQAALSNMKVRVDSLAAATAVAGSPPTTTTAAAAVETSVAS
nr:unnamed protein product [Spirometra erinaceieuropaei]